MADKIIHVVEDSLACMEMRRLTANTEPRGGSLSNACTHTHYTYPGASVMGRRTHLIVVSRDLYRRLVQPETDVASQMAARWWHENMLCRLLPKGKIVTV